MNTSTRLRQLADRMGLDGFAEELREIAVELEAKAAPAVPQGWKLVPIEPTPDMEGAGRVNMAYGSCTARQVWVAMLAATPAAPSQPVGELHDEPFGYFKAEPFGWTDCEKEDEGAKPLYERPQVKRG